MASTTSRIDEAAKTGRPVKGANFGSRSERKAYRKSLRSMVSNKIVDKQLNRKEKQEYYRKLRLVKLRRRKIAHEFRVLVEFLTALERQVARVHTRVPAANPAVVDAAVRLISHAVKAASETAGDFEAFSRRSVLRYRTDGKKAA
jgi:hypothetical protein